MAYEVTATRKRPQSFDELDGQDFVVASLSNSIASGRIAHAYLFSGPRGVGKTSAARILAKSLNCESGPTATPCGTCANCKEITRGNSLDVIEIDGASNTSVNDVREIRDEVLFSPNSARYKVYIIDEVHMLSNSAFNALLKTIEEPPPYIVFVFATTEVHKVPATIRSRCQQFNFRLIGTETIVSRLQVISDEMDISADSDALFWMAKEAAGSLRDAYTLYDQIVSFAEGSITMDVIQEKLGLVGFDRINALAELLAKGDARAAIELASEIISQGVAVEQMVNDLTDYFRGVLFARHGIERESLVGFNPAAFSPAVMERLSVRQVEFVIGELLEFYRAMRYSLNERYELELLLSKLSIAGDYVDGKELVDRIEALRGELHRGSGPGDGGTGSTPDAGTGGSGPRGGSPGGAPGEGPETERSSGTADAGSASERMVDGGPRGGAPGGAQAGDPSGVPGDGHGAERTAGTAGAEPESERTDRSGSGGKTPESGQHDGGQGPNDDESAPFVEDAAVEPDVASVTTLQEPQTPGDAETAEQPAVAVGGEHAIPDSQRKQIIDEIRRTRLSLATALDNTGTWRVSDGELTIPCPSPFHAESVRRELPHLSQAVQSIAGRAYRVHVQHESDDNDEDSDEDSETHVDMIKRVFRGEIIDNER